MAPPSKSSVRYSTQVRRDHLPPYGAPVHHRHLLLCYAFMSLICLWLVVVVYDCEVFGTTPASAKKTGDMDMQHKAGVRYMTDTEPKRATQMLGVRYSTGLRTPSEAGALRSV